MTCVVGIETLDGVLLASDSLSGDGHVYANVDTPKVFRLGAYAIGFAYSWRLGDVLRHHIRLPPPPKSPSALHRHLVTRVVPEIRTALRDLGQLSAGPETTQGTIIIGARGRVYTMCPDLQVNRPAHGYTAIGSARATALGALCATRGFPPRERARVALEAAEEHEISARRPWRFVFVARDA